MGRILFLCAAVLVTGCTTPIALRRSTVMQAQTVTDIHQQQVLDNLAKFVADPYAVPSFAHATQGTDQMTDQGSGGLSGTLTEFMGDSLCANMIETTASSFITVEGEEVGDDGSIAGWTAGGDSGGAGKTAAAAV